MASLCLVNVRKWTFLEQSFIQDEHEKVTDLLFSISESIETRSGLY